MFAIGAGFMYILMIRWLDLTGFKYELITQRNAMDLSQLIVSNSPLVKRDSSGEPIKLLLEAVKLDNYENSAGIGTEYPSEERENWEKCCDFLDFDYSLTVIKFKKENGRVVPDQTWTISNLIFDRTSDCYIPRIMGVGDVPVVIYENGERYPGVSIVQMTRTPVSDLSFWLSQAFVRAAWCKYWSVFSSEGTGDYSVTIPLDPEIECVKIFDPDPGDNYKRVCVFLRKRCVGEYECKRYTYPGECTSHENCDWIDSIEKVCKNFVFMSVDDEGIPITFDDNGNNQMNDECFNVDLIVKKGKVTVSYPGKDRNNEWC